MSGKAAAQILTRGYGHAEIDFVITQIQWQVLKIVHLHYKEHSGLGYSGPKPFMKYNL